MNAVDYGFIGLVITVYALVTWFIFKTKKSKKKA
jgi:hypothetical protein